MTYFVNLIEYFLDCCSILYWKTFLYVKVYKLFRVVCEKPVLFVISNTDNDYWSIMKCHFYVWSFYFYILSKTNYVMFLKEDLVICGTFFILLLYEFC